jgi:hydroxymethylbilane synthase
MTRTIIKVGTRGSRLAQIQCDEIIKSLQFNNPEAAFEKKIIKTEGDLNVTSPLDKIGGAGLFTKTIEKKLLAGEIDAAVHSAKDLPAIMTGGLILAAVPARESCEDVWLSVNGQGWHGIEAGSTVGTGSPRRRAQLLYLRKDLKFVDMRGNIETRIGKMNDGHCKALIMARAALKRLNMEEKITEVLPLDNFLPAPGQGFLAVQIRADDAQTATILSGVDNQDAHRCLDVERLLLAKLGAGCSTAIGAMAESERHRIKLRAVILDKEGTIRLNSEADIYNNETDEELVKRVIGDFLRLGGEKIISDYRNE